METNKKYCVVTFLFNKYDLLREVLIVDENADYYCLTDDKNLKSNTWNCIYIKEFDTDKLSGIQKTYMTKYSFYHFLPNDYKYYITIDASIEVADILSPIIDFADYNNFNIGLSLHPERTKWSEEYTCWINQRGLNEKYYKIFNDFASSNGFNSSDDNGIIECTVKIYKNEPIVINFINEIYNTLKETNNFEDKNDQCYLTCIYSKYIEKVKPFYFTRQLYSNSIFFNSYYHNSNLKWVNSISIENNTNQLFGEKINLYKFPTESNIDIFIGTHKKVKPIVKNNIYKIIVGNHRIKNDTNLELIKCEHKSDLDDKFYSEIYMLNHLSKKYDFKKYVGFCHYRKYFNFLDDIPNMDELFSKYDCIVSKPIELKMTAREQYGFFHNIEDLEIVEKIIKEKYPEYNHACELFLNGKLLVPYNMFIMKREDFREYIKFVWGVLDEYVKIVGTDITKHIEDNKDKYLKTWYPNNTIEYQYRIGGYLAERLTNIFLMKKFKKMKIYGVTITEDKYKKGEKNKKVEL